MRPLANRRPRKVDMTQGYMIDDIGYSIVLLTKVMGVLTIIHLETWMVHFIETIKTRNLLIDWPTIISNNLDEKLIQVKSDHWFYITSYIV